MMTAALADQGLHDDAFWASIEPLRPLVGSLTPEARATLLVWLQSLRDLVGHDRDPDGWEHRVSMEGSAVPQIPPRAWFDDEVERLGGPRVHEGLSLDGRPFLETNEAGTPVVLFGMRDPVPLTGGNALLAEMAALSGMLAGHADAVALLEANAPPLVHALCFGACVLDRSLPAEVLHAAGFDTETPVIAPAC